MTSLFINDQEVEVTPGTSILEACRENGHDVPYFCYHPELSVAANCRMCLVEVEGWGKPAASCCTPVSEGMKVKTQTESLAKDREMVMEYLLIHHPLDCPVCDQGGSCKLQDYAVEHGTSKGRYAEPKRAVVNYELGPFVNTCMTRCIHCTRCVRFADEVAGTGDIGILNRSDHMSIAGIVEEALESELSGNLPDICPVGALLDKPSHDVSRPWEMSHHNSTCTQCPNGCDISIESRGEEVMRIRPVADSPEPWICDRGRYVYDAFRSDNRILKPTVARDGELAEVTWDEAFEETGALLKGKRVGILFSPDWSIEGQMAIRLMRDALFPDAKVAYGLHRRDMRTFAFEEGFSMTTAQIEAADQVVVLGSDLRQRLPLLMQRLRKRSRAGKPVSRIGAMNYRTNMDIDNDALIRPRDWPAVIARAMEQVSEVGKTAAGFDAWMAAVPERHETAGKVLADALLAGTCALLVGEEVRAHEDAAAIISGLDLLMRACGHAESDNDGRNLIPEGMNRQVLSATHGDVRVSAGDIFAAATSGDLDALIVIGSDPVGDGLFPSAAKAALAKVPVVQIGSISGEMAEYAKVQLPAAAYSEIEGTFVNMEGRLRVASNPIKSLGQERPLWKVMMRMIQVMGGEPPVVNLEELRSAVADRLPELTAAWAEDKANRALIKPRRNRDASFVPAARSDSFELDVVSRYSMYREGMWARASDLLSEAGRIHALDDVLVHPDTLAAKGLSVGENKVKTFLGEATYHIGVREDVSPGVLFVGKRGVAGDLSDVSGATIEGGAA